MKGRLLGAVVVLVVVGMLIYWGEGLDREMAFVPEEDVADTEEEWSDDADSEPGAPDAGAPPAVPPLGGDPPPVASDLPEPPGEPVADALSQQERIAAAERETIQRPPEAAGPLVQLKKAYAAESADAEAEAVEQRIRALFGTEYLPEKHFRSVSCHRTVCKVGLFWSREQPLTYMALAMKLGENKMNIIATEPLSAPDAKGMMPLDMYALRVGFTLEEIE